MEELELKLTLLREKIELLDSLVAASEINYDTYSNHSESLKDIFINQVYEYFIKNKTTKFKG